MNGYKIVLLKAILCFIGCRKVNGYAPEYVTGQFVAFLTSEACCKPAESNEKVCILKPKFKFAILNSIIDCVKYKIIHFILLVSIIEEIKSIYMVYGKRK